MRIGLIVVIPLLLAALMLSDSSGAAAAGRKRCETARTTTLARNAQVRVYRLRANRVFACHLRSRRANFLGFSGQDDASDVQSLQELRLAGRYVAFGDQFGCERYYGDCGGSVKVIDVRTGKRKHLLTVEDLRLAGEPPSQVPELWDLALQPNGSAALIIGPTEARELEVWKLDSQGNVRLDHGPDVERGSLAASRRWVYWRRGGNSFSAALR